MPSVFEPNIPTTTLLRGVNSPRFTWRHREVKLLFQGHTEEPAGSVSGRQLAGEAWPGSVQGQQWARWGNGLVGPGGKPCSRLWMEVGSHSLPCFQAVAGCFRLGRGEPFRTHRLPHVFQVPAGRTERPQNSTDIPRRPQVSPELHILIPQMLVECPLGAMCWQLPSCLHNPGSWRLPRCPLL